MLSFLSNILSPVSDIIDNVSTTDEERMTLRNELAKIESKLESEAMKLEAKAMEATSRMAVAESKSDSWFTRTYRPAIISGMFVMICLNAFGVIVVPLPDVFTTVFGAAFGITSAGRSVEKYRRLRK
jgi:hypothetical protein